MPSAMETRLSKEALLRQLLDAERTMPDDNMIYSYLLGYRLFQSPELLLREIKSRCGTPASPEIQHRFMRRDQRMVRSKDSSACAKCQKKRQNPKTVSKSTNNMLERDRPTLTMEMIRANVMMQAPKRNLGNVENEEELSPALSTSLMSNSTLAKSSDFDDIRDISMDFDEDNRRNTAPPAALRALPSPQKLGKYTEQSSSQVLPTTTSSGIFANAASMGAILERLPETNIDDVQISEDIIVMGDDTIRRRRKGRKQTTAVGSESVKPSSGSTLQLLKPSDESATDRRSVASRDSGILSGLLEHEMDGEFQSNNNNNNTGKKATISSAAVQPGHSSKSSADSGFMNASSTIASDSVEQLAKDIESQICEHLCEESSVPNESYARQLHLLHVLLVWVRDFPSDFAKTEVSTTLKGLISSLEKDSQDLKEHCTLVLDTLTRSTDARNAERQLKVKSDTLPRDEHFQDTKEAMIAMVTGMSDTGDANKMAEQLCLIEIDLLSRLGAEEFLQMFHSNGDEESNTNLGACVRWFNHLSHLVATSVCLCRKPKHRRQVISLFTKAAARCYELSNFNSAMAILTGLSLGAVARLKRTWSKIDNEDLEQLQAVFDPSNNFRRYRKMFNSRWAAMRDHQESEEEKASPVPESNRYSTASQHSVTSRLSVASVTSQHRDSGIECENDSSATSTKTSNSSSSSATSSPEKKFTFDDVDVGAIENGVLVPFLTLMVKDVYFLNHSTPTIEQNGTINFEKLRHLGEILHPLETWKNKPCVFKKNEKLQDFLLNSPVLKDAELYNLSYKREPPKNKFEKNQLKTIRAELEYSKRGNMVRRMIARRKTM